MTRNEKINRNIGLTFDFIRQITDNPEMLDKIPSGTVLEFIEKDFKIVEKKKICKSVSKKSPKRYLKVTSKLELIG